MSRKQKAPVKIIGERDIQLHLSNPAHHDQIVRIGKALSSPIDVYKRQDMGSLLWRRPQKRAAGNAFLHPVA